MKTFKEKYKTNYIYYLMIIISSLIISIPLFSKDLNVCTDDGIQHICRLIGTYQTIEAKQFLPLIMSNFCNNFGYSWNIFYSPFTSYVPLLLKIFNLSYIQILKVFMFIVTLISGITMYKFTKRILKGTKIVNDENNVKKIATLSAILYILAPYRITDMYIRVALAEQTSFIFIPIIFEGMYIIINENKKSYKLAIGTIGLILTHTVITMYTAILCLIYLIIFIIKKIAKSKSSKEAKKEVLQIIINLIQNILLAIVITSFYWVPLLEHYLATSYEVFVPGRMQRIEVLEYYKINFHELFLTTNNQTMIYEIGLVTVIGLILTPIAMKKVSKEYKTIHITFLVIGIILTIMTLNIFPFEKLPSILTMIQFTFRLFEFTAFLFSFIAAVNYGVLIKNFKIKDVIVLTTLTALLIIPYKNKIDFEGTTYKEKDLLEPIKLTENTGRVHAGMASMEYMPSKMFNNLDYVTNRKDEPIILNEVKTIISYYEKDGSNMQLEISNVEENTIIELPYTYYLGYRIYQDGNEIKYTESDKGFIQITLEKACNNSKIQVKYLGTNAMLASYCISILGAIILIIFIYKEMEKRKNDTNRIFKKIKR